MSSIQKLAIITGASQGIGAALVTAYRKLGYAVVANSRSIGKSDDPDVLTVPGASVPDCTGAAVYEIAGVEYVTFEFGGSSTVAIAGGQTIKGNALVTFALPPAAAAAAKAKAK